MKKLSLLLVLALLIGIIPVSAAETAVSVLHVSPDGRDSNPGSENAPFKTLEAAKRAANLEKAKGAKGVTVLFHGGEYLCSTKVLFTGEDSGTEDCPITYKAAGDGEVVFLGSTKVNIDEFTAVTDESVLERLPEAARDRVGQLDLSKYGITSKALDMTDRIRTNDRTLGTIQRVHNGIYLNGKRQPISRYPNTGFNHFGNVIKGGSKASGGGIFEFSEPNPKKWINVKDAYVTGFFGTDYEGYTVRIDHVDQKDNYIYVAEGTREPIKSGFRWAAEHLIEEMDIPGEWYADKDNLMLYYYPSHPLDSSVDTMRIATMEDPFIELSGVSYVNFEGLTFRENLSDGILITRADNASIKSCTLAEIGAVGINVTTANRLTIDGCDIYNTGYQGVYVNYAGSQAEMRHCDNIISNCHFYGNGRDSDYNFDGGIYFNSSVIGFDIKNNILHNINNPAIRYYGMENNISNNEFFNCARAAADTGVIYVGRTLNAFGNHVDHNYIHDFGKMHEDGTTYGVYGIYWDDWVSGQSAEGNIIVPNNYKSVIGILSFGNYNEFRYNTIANANRPVSFTFRNGWKVGENATVMNSLNSTPPLALEMYPGMMDTKNKIIANDGYITQENVDVSYNVAYSTPSGYALNEYLLADGKTEDNRTFETPDVFVDPDNHDWRIKASAMEEYGLNENIPNENNFSMDDIGFQSDVREIKKADDKFYKTYPQNGAGGVSLSDFGLAWEEAIFADEYHYTVATDYELTDVVAQGVTNDTFVNIPNLETGKIYYWTVKAKNLSKQLGNEWNSEGDVYVFSTKGYEEVYYYFLESAIEEAENLLPAIVEGTEIGSYSVGSRDILKAAIDKAKAERKTCKTQAEIDRAQAELRAVVSTMGQYVNLGYENLDASNMNTWQQTMGGTDTVFKKNGDAVVLEGTSALMATRKKLSNYTIKRFRLKLTYDVGKTPGSTWAAISLRQADPTINSWATGTVDYMIIIKSTLIELQKYYPTAGTAGVIATCENEGLILENEWADIEFGALDVAGGVEIVLNVNGKKVFDYYDDNLPIYADGYMTVQPPFNDNGTGSLEIASPLDSRDGEKYIPPEELFKKDTEVIYTSKSSEFKKEGAWKEENLLSYDNTSTIEVSDDKNAKVEYTMSGKKEEPRRLYYWHTPMENGDKHAVLNLNIGDGSAQTIDFAREIDFTSGEAGWVDLGAYPFESFTVDGKVVATLTGSGEGSIPAIVIKSVPATADDVSFSKLFYKNGENALMIQIGSEVYYDRLLRKQLDAPPVLINSTTMVPLRLIAEHFGGEVTWDAASQTARIVIDGKTVEVTLGKDSATLDGSAVVLAQPPVVTNSRVMIPMRSVSEIFEKEVYWNDAYKFVLVGDKLITGDFETAAFTVADTLFNN